MTTKTEQNNDIAMFNTSNEGTADWGYPILQEKWVAKC